MQVISQYLAAHSYMHVPDSEIAARTFMGTFIDRVITTQEMLHGSEVVKIDLNCLIDGLVRSILGH
jgi:hypothetical protein